LVCLQKDWFRKLNEQLIQRLNYPQLVVLYVGCPYGAVRLVSYPTGLESGSDLPVQTLAGKTKWVALEDSWVLVDGQPYRTQPLDLVLDLGLPPGFGLPTRPAEPGPE